MKKRSPIIPIVLAVVIGLAVMVFLNSTVKPTPVVVAKIAIAPGTVLSEELVEIRTLPAGGVPDGAFSTLEEVVGKSLAVARAESDIIMASVLGDNVSAGIPSQLETGHVAIAVNVDKASAVAGMLRAGQTVSIIGMLTPDVLSSQSGLASSYQTIITDDGSVDMIQNSMTNPTPTAEPVLGPLGRITITGVRVLLVPQNFQYQEVASTSDQEELFASEAMTSEDESVIVLDVPTTPIMISEGVYVNAATLIATLNEYGSIYLVLESSTVSAETVAIAENNLTINLAELYSLINEESAIKEAEGD
jgi:Flp pilus assembly protein CpaB